MPTHKCLTGLVEPTNDKLSSLLINKVNHYKCLNNGPNFILEGIVI